MPKYRKAKASNGAAYSEAAAYCAFYDGWAVLDDEAESPLIAVVDTETLADLLVAMLSGTGKVVLQNVAEGWPGRVELRQGGSIGPGLAYLPQPTHAEWDLVEVGLDFVDGTLRALIYDRDNDEPRIRHLMTIEQAQERAVQAADATEEQAE